MRIEKGAKTNPLAADGSVQLSIREFRPADTRPVIDLWTRCALVRPWNDPEKDIHRKRSVPDGPFWVGLLGDRLIASIMVGYDGHRGSVNYLAVDPAHAGTGFGRQLMDRAEAWLKERGCPKVNLCVRTGNEAVLAFYDRLDYQPDDALLLGKRLIPDD